MKEKVKGWWSWVKRLIRGNICIRWIYIFLVIYIVLLYFNFWFVRKEHGNYDQQEVPLINSGENFSDVEYHFYLDFSPSMRGFMWEEINSNMAVLADILMRFDYLGKEQTLYWCDDKISKVEAENFYASMSGTNQFDKRNKAKLTTFESDSERIQEQLEQIIGDIDLSDIFTHRYEDGMIYSKEKKDLNVIITDFNFMKEDDESSQQELSGRFADNIATLARDCNISIYQIYSRFAGKAIDSVTIQEEVPNNIENRNLYMIVISGNDEAYQNFTGYIEQELVKKGVDVSEKFELLNNFRSADANLVIDKQNLLAMNLIENKNMNLDNDSFKKLASNAMGMRLVKGKGASSINMCVAPVTIPGYNNPSMADDSKLNVKVRVYNPIGRKQYEENSEVKLIKSANADFMWVQEQLYLRLLMELDSEAVPTGRENSIEILKNIGRKEFYVLDIQFYMERPSYSLPSWVEEENELGISDICRGIAESKEAACIELDETSRYLGTMVIYMNY